MEELPVKAGINTVTNYINGLKMSFHHKKVVRWHFLEKDNHIFTEYFSLFGL